MGCGRVGGFFFFAQGGGYESSEWLGFRGGLSRCGGLEMTETVTDLETESGGG